LWKGKKKILNLKHLKVTSPKVSLPKWWVAEGEDEVYMEVYPNYILIYRIDFACADEVLKRLKGRCKQCQ